MFFIAICIIESCVLMNFDSRKIFGFSFLCDNFFCLYTVSVYVTVIRVSHACHYPRRIQVTCILWLFYCLVSYGGIPEQSASWSECWKNCYPYDIWRNIVSFRAFCVGVVAFFHKAHARLSTCLATMFNLPNGHFVKTLPTDVLETVMLKYFSFLCALYNLVNLMGAVANA